MTLVGAIPPDAYRCNSADAVRGSPKSGPDSGTSASAASVEDLTCESAITRTGIEQLVIDEDPNNMGGIFLRDVATSLDDVHFGSVTAEITIGTGATADKLTGTAQLVEKQFGSGNWRFHREP